MKILVACEFSGRVRDAFIKAGHNAVSVDLLPSERPGPHIQDDVIPHLADGWDMMIAFPPCTALCNSGNRTYARTLKRAESIEWTQQFFDAPIPRVCIENPVGVLSTEIRPPEQIIQPWHFGYPWKKATCLWLANLPPLKSTKVVLAKHSWYDTCGGRVKYPNEYWRARTRLPWGIANAMAEQWGKL